MNINFSEISEEDLLRSDHCPDSHPTKLLLMSGSVANPLEVADWLRSIGRQVELVSEEEDPFLWMRFLRKLCCVRFVVGKRGHWPKLVAGALSANLGPLLIFAQGVRRLKISQDNWQLNFLQLKPWN